MYNLIFKADINKISKFIIFNLCVFYFSIMFPRVIEVFYLKDIYKLVFDVVTILAIIALVYFFKKRVKGFKLINAYVAYINVLMPILMIFWLLSTGMHY